MQTAAQDFTRKIISLEFATGVYDTLDGVEIDTIQRAGFSTLMKGLDIESEASLPSSINFSINDLVPTTQFSNPIVASEFFELDKYPISTAVKLFDNSGASRRDLCSGVMISDRHVLSSGHCVFEAYTTNSLTRDVEAQIFYDATLNVERTYGSKVKKVYFLDGWNISRGDDIAIFELEENIGVMSGWMSIGYNDDDSYFESMHMHKLAYPTYSTPFNDYPFNGDTLYYSHGNVDFINKDFLGVLRHLSGVGGESGSPIFEHTEGERCVAYGVLTWLGNYSHSRFTKERYFAFSSLLPANDVSTSTSEQLEEFDVRLFPNPASELIQLSFPNDIPYDKLTIRIFDSHGRLLINRNVDSREPIIYIEDLQSGMLFVHINKGNQIVATRPLVKY